MWLDNASEVDILFYEPYANVIADISKNPNYKPLTIGVFGVWGAGKSTLLKLIEQKIDEDSEGKGKTLCININAWTFEGYEDAKIALMEALLREIKEHKDIPSRVKNGVSKLLKKLDFFKLATKAVSVGAPMIASVATGNPIPLLLSVSGKAEDVGNGIKSVADAMQSIRDDYLKDEESDDANSIVNNVRKFRKEFKEALRDDGVENVIVLIDDLDRCQPDRIIETLEAINRLHIDLSGCDCVSLFSGGLDSYCGAIKLLQEGHSPVLVGHNEYPKLRYIQEQFCSNFNECYPSQKSVFLGFTAGARAPFRLDGERLQKSENTSRGRSLLFLCAAISIAGIMGKEIPVYIPENGFIGLNVALTNSRKGSCSTRTTHPYFLNSFNKLIASVGIQNRIFNFFAFKTKREIVNLVSKTKAFKQGYKNTISCSHPCVSRYNRVGSREYPVNCGFCYPCIIRKGSLQDVELDTDENLKASEFLKAEANRDKSADLFAVLSSIHRYKELSEKDIERLIRCTGRLGHDEIQSFKRVYRQGMDDLIEYFSKDSGMEEWM